jgi:hypothetical protein
MKNSQEICVNLLDFYLKDIGHGQLYEFFPQKISCLFIML